MKITTLAVTRPVATTVLALLLMVLGAAALLDLPVREYPDIDDPSVTVTVVYPGASASVVQREVSEPVEEVLSGIDGVRRIRSSSRDGRARIEVQFSLDRNLDLAAADVRDRVSTIRNELPDQAEAPEIAQRSLESQVSMWLVLTSDALDRLDLSDFADRVLVDPLSTVPGVSTVLFGGERRYAMRVRLDLDALASHGLTVLDVERALRERNIELPAGRLVSETRELTLRTMTELERPESFRDLILRDEGGTQIRLGQVAEVSHGPEVDRTSARLDGQEAIGLGVVRQSGSNLVAVSQAVRERLEGLESRIPDDVNVEIAYDASVFVEASIHQIVRTLVITIALVVAVVFFALGSWRATLVPAATIPASAIGAFILLYLFGFSINVLTLLALILAIGMLVDDAIVVSENVFRYSERGKPRLLAADLGASEVVFAVLSTTAVLLAVIAPLALLSGDAGRLFSEFAAGLGGALGISSLMALTLGVTVASKLIDAGRIRETRLYRTVSSGIDAGGRGYQRILRRLVAARWLVAILALLVMAGTWWLYRELPRELSPREDRGSVFIPVAAPEGATMKHMLGVMKDIESVLLPLTGEDGPAEHVIGLIAPRSAGQGPVNSGIVILRLKDWSERERSQFEVTASLLPKLGAITGAQVFAINPPSLAASGFEQPVQMAITGDDLDQVNEWAQQVLARARQLPGLEQARLDYQPTSPQLQIRVDRDRAAALGVPIAEIGRTLQILMGGQDVTDFSIDAETYEVMVRAQPEDRSDPEDLSRVQVRAEDGSLVSLGGLVETRLIGRASELIRVDRLPAITLEGSLADGAALGDVLDALEREARELLPATAHIRFLGVSEDYQRSGRAFVYAFGLAMVIVFLVLAAQFESFVQPIVLLAGVPLALFGALAALWLGGGSINLYSQIGFILAIGLMAKNAILLVEFVNQLRDRGREIRPALEEAARVRFRPIMMTSVATLFGALPLALATGPGAETRRILGLVIIGGVVAATLLTLLLVPVLYLLLAGASRPRAGLARELERQRRSDGDPEPET
ncbi:efflux RND transporter permease subunit [Imhoffiella purpurea]|uniref:RND multidrug efflux transporter n=1 Tax=Imhoffiella purpurea TaxID=1249627 RepID=W9VCS6_9GAMM|nr:efflux RND transporter permease subunit [Imhoffiella purpurea]EXJ14801.1 RND multidrug efflux transporter [Imhoffiella purpurea]